MNNRLSRLAKLPFAMTDHCIYQGFRTKATSSAAKYFPCVVATTWSPVKFHFLAFILSTSAYYFIIFKAIRKHLCKEPGFNKKTAEVKKLKFLIQWGTKYHFSSAVQTKHRLRSRYGEQPARKTCGPRPADTSTQAWKAFITSGTDRPVRKIKRILLLRLLKPDSARTRAVVSPSFADSS